MGNVNFCATMSEQFESSIEAVLCVLAYHLKLYNWQVRHFCMYCALVEFRFFLIDLESQRVRIAILLCVDVLPPPLTFIVIACQDVKHLLYLVHYFA